jgi:hypothetical protein
VEHHRRYNATGGFKMSAVAPEAAHRFTRRTSSRFDRPHLRIQDPDLLPKTFRLCLLQQNHPAVLLSVLRRISGTKRHSGPDVISRRIWISFR